MAATISVNFASEPEVYQINPPDKKSVSAKLLSDVLGGGVVSGGYVRKTGDAMTGFLTLTTINPVQDWHAAPKRYVDSRAYTRRYYFQCSKSLPLGPGICRPGMAMLSGLDLYTNPFYFFDKGDVSTYGITRYLDVYRNGILQVYGSDYDIINSSTITGAGLTAVRFFQPFTDGATFQVNIGNVGATPVTFGVNVLYDGYGIKTSAVSGDVTISVTPSSFAASSLEVSQKTETNKFVSPGTLSAYPLIPKASGLFRKDPSYDRIGTGNLLAPYGNANGDFQIAVSNLITAVKSNPDNSSPAEPNRVRVYFAASTIGTTNYIPFVTINTEYLIPEDTASATVASTTRTLSSFDFFVYDNFWSNPLDIYEINIIVY
jgi:hypothetical protein